MLSRLIQKRCRYSSLKKFEDASDTALHFMRTHLRVPGQMAKCGQPSNWWVLLFLQKLVPGQSAANPRMSLPNLVILGQTILEIFESPTL